MRNTEEAREKRERFERAGKNRPNSFLKNYHWKAASMCLPVCGQCEGVMTGFCRAAEVRQLGKRKHFNNNMMSSKRVSITHRPQAQEAQRNFNAISLLKEFKNKIILLKRKGRTCHDDLPKITGNKNLCNVLWVTLSNQWKIIQN